MNKYILSAVATVANLTACATLEHKPYPDEFTPPSLSKSVQKLDVDTVNMVNKFRNPDLEQQFAQIISSTRICLFDLLCDSIKPSSNLLALEDIKPQSQTD